MAEQAIDFLGGNACIEDGHSESVVAIAPKDLRDDIVAAVEKLEPEPVSDDI